MSCVNRIECGQMKPGAILSAKIHISGYHDPMVRMKKIDELVNDYRRKLATML